MQLKIEKFKKAFFDSKLQILYNISSSNVKPVSRNLRQGGNQNFFFYKAKFFFAKGLILPHRENFHTF
jgi:hypothetical protein